MVTRQLVKAVIASEMATGYGFPMGEARGIAEAYYSTFYVEDRLPSAVELLDIACEVVDYREARTS